MLRAVVDTSVLFEGLTHLGAPAQVIDAWVAGDFLPCVSTALRPPDFLQVLEEVKHP